MKKTAVNFLIEQITSLDISNISDEQWFGIVGEARAMERQQIIDIDHRLSVIEDYAKGEAADEITKLRKYIAQTFTEPKND
jgi:hypothetical protein